MTSYGRQARKTYQGEGGPLSLRALPRCEDGLELSILYSLYCVTILYTFELDVLNLYALKTWAQKLDRQTISLHTQLCNELLRN